MVGSHRALRSSQDSGRDFPGRVSRSLTLFRVLIVKGEAENQVQPREMTETVLKNNDAGTDLPTFL